MQQLSDTQAPEHTLSLTKGGTHSANMNPLVTGTVSQESFDAFQAARFREIGMLTRSLIEAEDAIEQERRAHEATRAALEKAEFNLSHGYNEILDSTSWRVTAPLRWISTKIRG